MPIRKQIQDLIYSQNVASAEDGAEVVFKSFADKKAIGDAILDAMFTKIKAPVDAEDTPVFYSDDRERRAGYLSSIYGCVGVLSLVNRYGAELDEEQKAFLTKNIYYIVDTIKSYGYTLYPYLTTKDNQLSIGGATEALFDKRHPYTGAMTWALSFFTSVRQAVRAGNLTVDPAYMERIDKEIAFIVQEFVEAVVVEEDPDAPDDGEDHTLYRGWSYTRDCERPSLFFTYSVLEAFSDFEDATYNIGFDENGVIDTTQVKDAELLEKINHNNKKGEPRQDKWRRICRAVANNVWEVYKDDLKEDFVNDIFLRGHQAIHREDLGRMERSNALFNTLYIVFILIYGYVNVTHPDKRDVVNTMESALQNVQHTYEQLRQKGHDYLIDTYTIPFLPHHRERGELYTKRLNHKHLTDASLLPMLVKANNIAAFYITRYPVKQMGVFYEMLFDEENISRDTVLWEDRGYDVKITERYIEAVADFHDYYEKYEKDYLNKFEQAREEGKKAGIRKARRDVEQEHAAAIRALEEQHTAALAATRASFLIENAINDAIRKSASELMTTAFANIAASIRGEDVALSDFECSLKESMIDVMKEYVLSIIRDIMYNKNSFDTVKENMKRDLSVFVAEWTEKLESTPEVLSKIIKKSREEDN